MKIKPSRIIELVNVKRGGAHDLMCLRTTLNSGRYFATIASCRVDLVV